MANSLAVNPTANVALSRVKILALAACGTSDEGEHAWIHHRLGDGYRVIKAWLPLSGQHMRAVVKNGWVRRRQRRVELPTRGGGMACYSLLRSALAVQAAFWLVQN